MRSTALASTVDKTAEVGEHILACSPSPVPIALPLGDQLLVWSSGGTSSILAFLPSSHCLPSVCSRYCSEISCHCTIGSKYLDPECVVVPNLTTVRTLLQSSYLTLDSPVPFKTSSPRTEDRPVLPTPPQRDHPTHPPRKMKTTTAILLTTSTLLTTLSAQQNYAIDPDSVDDSTKQTWCTNQQTQCPL